MRAFKSILCLVVILLLSGTAVMADVPDSISFQGILTDSEGNPVTTTVSVVFAIYDDPERGMPLWSETQSVTPDDHGRFNVMLGGGVLVSADPLSADIFQGPNRWLEYGVEGTPLLPRIPFSVVPYAYRVQTVDGSEGGAIDGDVAISGELDVGSVMFPDGTSQTTASGMRTQGLWGMSENINGTQIFTNETGSTIYITSIFAEGSISSNSSAIIAVGPLWIFMRISPSDSKLWTGGGVPIPWTAGGNISITTGSPSQITLVGFTE